MLFPQLDRIAAPPAEQPPLEERAAIVAEIAERLIELEESHHGMAADLIYKLAQLFQLSPLAFRLALEGLRGNTHGLTASWEEVAGWIGGKKQSHHYRFIQAVKALRATFPQLANALEKIRHDALGKFASPETGEHARDHLHV